MSTYDLKWIKTRGRNGYDAPAELPDDMAAECLNIRLRRDAIGEKRYGASVQTPSGTFSGFNALANFVPSQDDTAAELHFLDRTGTVKMMRVAAGTAAVALTLTDAVASLPQHATWAILNGKLYWAYDSAVNRLHVYDPRTSTTVCRRVGLPIPAAPTAGNSGSGGSYAAVARLYRARWIAQLSGRIQRKSDSTTSVSFTPSGSNDAAVVTRPTAPGEGETHWQVEVSADGGSTWYVLSGQIAIATTTYSDTTATTAYADGTPADLQGANTAPPSARFVLSTGERLLMFGAYETSTGDGMMPFNGRVWYTPVLSTSADESDDDERISNTSTSKGYIDISRDSGAGDRAICGPMNGMIYVFQSRGFYMLVPTGNDTNPYRRVVISNQVGALNHETTFVGEDEAGQPCVYFWDPARGPYRYGVGGLQWLGYDIQDIVATVNQDATNKVAHGVFNQEDRLVHYWVATGSSSDPDTGCVFNVREGQPTKTEGVRYGWTKDTGASATGRCSVMFASTIGATMSRKRKPYVGLASVLLKTEDASATQDNGVSYQSYVDWKVRQDFPWEARRAVTDGWLLARTNTGVTITCTIERNNGDETARTSTVSLTALNGESRVLRRFEDAALEDAYCYKIRLGDSAAANNAWRLDHFAAKVEMSGQVKGNVL